MVEIEDTLAHLHNAGRGADGAGVACQRIVRESRESSDVNKVYPQIIKKKIAQSAQIKVCALQDVPALGGDKERGDG